MLRQLAQALLNRRATLLSASAAFAGLHVGSPMNWKACNSLSSPVGVPPPTTPTNVTTLTHIFVPEETNPSGNVHGGSILRHIEQAGWLAAARHCASSGTVPRSARSCGECFTVVFCRVSGAVTAPPACATARLEHIDFWAPVFTGNVAEFQARYSECLLASGLSASIPLVSSQSNVHVQAFNARPC
jgi:acyl-coenzyme A thioesterase PaaI-like protein